MQDTVDNKGTGQAAAGGRLSLYLLRHAESEYNNGSGRVGGRSNGIKLTNRGIHQANALAARLRQEGRSFSLVYASPAVRAMRTASIVCEEMGLPRNIICVREDLQEMSQGDWEGKYKGELYTPEVMARMRSDPLNYSAPNGESQLQVRTRMLNFAGSELLNKIETGKSINVAVFGHGFSFKCLLGGIIGSDPAFTYRIRIDNCSITELSYTSVEDPGWNVVRVNDFQHVVGIGYSA